MDEAALRKRIRQVLKQKAVISGGDFNDIMSTIGSVAKTASSVLPFLGLGISADGIAGAGVSAGALRGKKGRKARLAAVRKHHVEAGSFLQDLPIVGPVAQMLGLGVKEPRKPRKPTAYNKFVSAFAKQHPHLKGPQLMREAGAAWKHAK